MTTLFIISNIIILSGMLLYIYYMTKNKIDLNLSTRSIWIFLEIIDVISYLNIVEDGIKGLMAVISLASVVTLTIIAAKK